MGYKLTQNREGVASSPDLQGSDLLLILFLLFCITRGINSLRA
jgi:hypothetical protein